MQQFPDFFDVFEHFFGAFDFDFGSLLALILSLLGSIGGGGNSL
jgi:hypothetical protein